MIKWTFKRVNVKEIEANYDVLKRLDYLTKNKTQFIRIADFMPLTKKQFIQHILENLENLKNA